MKTEFNTESPEEFYWKGGNCKVKENVNGNDRKSA